MVRWDVQVVDAPGRAWWPGTQPRGIVVVVGDGEAVERRLPLFVTT